MEPWEHPSDGKSSGERKNVSVCGRSSLVQATCLQMLSNHTSTHYIHTHGCQISSERKRAREQCAVGDEECVRKSKKIGREEQNKTQYQREAARLRLCTEAAARSVTSNLPSHGCETDDAPPA